MRTLWLWLRQLRNNDDNKPGNNDNKADLFACNACTLSSSFPESLWPLHSLAIATDSERERERKVIYVCVAHSTARHMYVRTHTNKTQVAYFTHLFTGELYIYIFCLGASLTDYLHMTRPTHDSRFTTLRSAIGYAISIMTAITIAIAACTRCSKVRVARVCVRTSIEIECGV